MSIISLWFSFFSLLLRMIKLVSKHFGFQIPVPQAEAKASVLNIYCNRLKLRLLETRIHQRSAAMNMQHFYMKLKLLFMLILLSIVHLAI